MKDRKVPIIIVGATGFCGQGAVEALSHHPSFQVIAHIRTGSPRQASATQRFQAWGAEVLCCSFSELADEIQTLQPKVLASFIGTTKAQIRQYGGSYHSIDYQLNHNLLEIAKQSKNDPLFFYLSSMGAEWGKWNAYLRARMMIEEELEMSGLSYIIMRPGILSGQSRDQDRLGEEIGAWFSHRLAGFYEKLGLQGKSDATKPLDAPDVGRFVRIVLEEELQKETTKVEKIYQLPQIHQMLRER